MNIIAIGNKKYHDSNDVKIACPQMFEKCKNTRQLADMKKISECDYCYARIKDGKWIISCKSYPKAKLLLTQKYVTEAIKHLDDQKINAEPNPIKKIKINAKTKIYTDIDTEANTDTETNTDTESYTITHTKTNTYKELPPLLELEDDEKFKNDKNETVEIEVRGERDIEKCYFKVSDVSKAFDIPKLDSTIINNPSEYYKDSDYVFFTHVESGMKILFLTYGGLLRTLYATCDKHTNSFIKWSTLVLFAVHRHTHTLHARTMYRTYSE